MGTDNSAFKAWGGGGSRVEGLNGGIKGMVVMLSAIKTKYTYIYCHVLCQYLQDLSNPTHIHSKDLLSV